LAAGVLIFVFPAIAHGADGAFLVAAQGEIIAEIFCESAGLHGRFGEE
jgi:hypothetical protein